MKTRIFIVEDQFAEAHSLQLMLERAGYQVCGIARTMQTALESIEKEKPHLVLLDIFLKGRGTGIDLARKLKDKGIAFVYITANFDSKILDAAKETQPYGFLTKPFKESDVLVTLEIALFRHEFSIESKYHKVETIQKQLISLVSTEDSGRDLFLELGKILQPHISFDFLLISTISPGAGHKMICSYLRVGYHEYQKYDIKEWLTVTGLSELAVRDLLKTMPIVSEGKICGSEGFKKEEKFSGLVKMIGTIFQMQSLCCVPVFLFYDMPVQISFFSRRSEGYSSTHLDLLNSLRSTFQIYFQKSLPSNTNTSETLLSTKNSKPAIHHQNQAIDFPGIIGKSSGLLNVFDSIMQVAPFDTSVLLLGESGTGKERVAHCIQELSNRKEMPFVKVNCAVLPASLVESELFGHEKGAFTGALETYKGQFEQAMNGTIFLDEIGEIPMEVQVKLLRILQEKEIRRVGGRAPLKVNVRIIAATNRNLEELVAEGRFRLDLFYRLNVFPIQLPPLRERKEDIPLLALHFIKKYSNLTGKNIEGISDNVMAELMDYHWPGNIRELENQMERSVLISSGRIIKEMQLVKGVKPRSTIPTAPGTLKTIEENERDYILSVLKQCNGRIWGKGGAASLLNMPPTTLNSRIKKLGIKREFTG